jgi:hypothetical protein
MVAPHGNQKLVPLFSYRLLLPPWAPRNACAVLQWPAIACSQVGPTNSDLKAAPVTFPPRCQDLQISASRFGTSNLDPAENPEHFPEGCTVCRPRPAQLKSHQDRFPSPTRLTVRGCWQGRRFDDDLNVPGDGGSSRWTSTCSLRISRLQPANALAMATPGRTH